jgi:molybdate transport system ATP-binding protein
MNAVATISNARCRIGRQLLMEIDDFSIEAGQHWCLYGGNGSGKSLLAGLLCGRRIESGSYVSYMDGFDPTRDIHIVSFEEQQRLWQRDNRLDISEYVDNALDQGTIVSELIQSSRAAGEQRHDVDLMEALLSELALTEYAHRGIRFLSSGQIRRALIARALYAYRDSIPQLIILDDPLESIDKLSCEKIQNCIRRYLGEGNCSVQLCRRSQDIPDSASHFALMERSGLGTVTERITISRQCLMESLDQGSLQLNSKEIADFLSIPVSASAHRTTDDDILIRLEHVSASYGDQQVLENINWTMTGADHVVIEGPNGCGKSTLLSLIDGENHKAYGQSVTLFGRRRGSGETVWEIKSRFGVVSNELHNKYIKGWKVVDVVVSGFFDSVGLYDDSGSGESLLACQWLAALGIDRLRNCYYHEISFGQQRLVLLARAMVKSPCILILDEPCVGLDDYHRSLILTTLDKIGRQTSTRLIYVSHVDGERPGCINQKLEFTADEAGGFSLQQTRLPAD